MWRAYCDTYCTTTCTIFPNNIYTNSSRTYLAIIVNLIYQVEKHAQVSRHIQHSSHRLGTTLSQGQGTTAWNSKVTKDQTNATKNLIIMDTEGSSRLNLVCNISHFIRYIYLWSCFLYLLFFSPCFFILSFLCWLIVNTGLTLRNEQFFWKWNLIISTLRQVINTAAYAPRIMITKF